MEAVKIIDLPPRKRPRSVKPRCKTCMEIGVIIDKHDAYACLPCNVWLEEKCRPHQKVGETCEFCAGRPEKPKESE